MKKLTVLTILSIFLNISCLVITIKPMNNNNSNFSKYNTIDNNDFINDDSADEKPNNQGKRKRNEADDSAGVVLKKIKLESGAHDYVTFMQELATTPIRFTQEIIDQIKQNIFKQDPETGNTLLHCALNKSNYPLIKKILQILSSDKVEILVAIQNSGGHTPLHIAAQKNNLPFIQSVLELPLCFNSSLIEDVRLVACQCGYQSTTDYIEHYLENFYEQQKTLGITSLLMQAEIKPNGYLKLEQHFAPSKIAIQAKQSLMKVVKKSKSQERIDNWFSQAEDFSGYEHMFIRNCCSENDDICWLLEHISPVDPVNKLFNSLSRDKKDAILGFNKVIIQLLGDEQKKYFIKFIQENCAWIADEIPFFVRILSGFIFVLDLYDCLPNFIQIFHRNLGLYVNEDLVFEYIMAMKYKAAPIEGLKALLLLDPNINQQNELNATPLHLAIGYKNPEALYEILKHNPDVTLKNSKGICPLTSVAIGIIKDFQMSVSTGIDFKKACLALFKQALKSMTLDELKEKVMAELKPFFETFFKDDDAKVIENSNLVMSFINQVAET